PMAPSAAAPLRLVFVFCNFSRGSDAIDLPIRRSGQRRASRKQNPASPSRERRAHICNMTICSKSRSTRQWVLMGHLKIYGNYPIFDASNGSTRPMGQRWDNYSA
ncbi:MAG: hypothetical protein P4M15_10215, partial [Alphaproteobacteria bacterium]|nr:hypothetical protein [Alphaproteobacteria bacterium]